MIFHYDIVTNSGKDIPLRYSDIAESSRQSRWPSQYQQYMESGDLRPMVSYESPLQTASNRVISTGIV